MSLKYWKKKQEHETVQQEFTVIEILRMLCVASLWRRHLKQVELRIAPFSMFGSPVRCSHQLSRAVVESGVKDFIVVLMWFVETFL